jgi:hypothetical protein
MNTNIPNVCKIFQMAIKNQDGHKKSRWPLKMSTFSNLKFNHIGIFGSKNKPSCNPDAK